ncbi:Tat pathway signal protein [Kitasatospora sp. NPDC096147]|uniref:Tat pathway signal protein n=1 Tax=Kitasatospora sp. NPDC096147 TaxID=3364093 RepID=UPI0037F35183
MTMREDSAGVPERNEQLVTARVKMGWYRQVDAARGVSEVGKELFDLPSFEVSARSWRRWESANPGLPRHDAAEALCATFSTTLDKLGFTLPVDLNGSGGLGLGQASINDVKRRQVLGAPAILSLPLLSPSPGRSPATVGEGTEVFERTDALRSLAGAPLVGVGDIEAVRDAAALFSQMDQKRGGGHGRAAARYLEADVYRLLHGRFTNSTLRGEMFGAAAELAYLSGWMAFDSGEHSSAEQHFTVAVELSMEAGDPPLTAHILRAMAHQAVDLRRPRRALALASASLEGDRYRLASPRERALLGVVHARALAAGQQRTAAMTALLRAEDDLASARGSSSEPARVSFFGEASLAHETAATLRDVGDLPQAEGEFRRSVATRKATTYTRTHAVTLGYLGAVQAQMQDYELACATWSDALDAMQGVRSDRTRQTAMTMQAMLSAPRSTGVPRADEVASRAGEYLAATA